MVNFLRFIWLAVLAGVCLLCSCIAVIALFSEDGNLVAGVFGVLAILCVLFGWRTLRAIRHTDSPAEQSAVSAKRPARSGRRKYDQFRWGEPAPSRKQFGYAMSQGVVVRDGMDRDDLSEAIDDKMNEGKPATKDQLRTIRDYHGVLPRTVNRSEANHIIEFLEDHTLPCPFCGIEVFATDDSCCACQRSLKKLRVPIELD